jgi:hypothetical protein
MMISKEYWGKGHSNLNPTIRLIWISQNNRKRKIKNNKNLILERMFVYLIRCWGLPGWLS